MKPEQTHQRPSLGSTACRARLSPQPAKRQNPFLRLAVVFALAAWATGAISAAKSAEIEALVAQVKASGSAEGFLHYLSSLPVQEGSDRGYKEDGTPTDDLKKTRAAIRNELTSLLGAEHVSEQAFEASGYKGVNIIGTLPGSGSRSSEQYIVAAHYDSEQNPGADDDASGIAGMLEAARVLAGQKFEATIVFVALDQEESRDKIGEGQSGSIALQGSRHFAQKSKGQPIKGVVILDCIAYNDKGSNVVTICRPDKIGSPGATSEAETELSGSLSQAFKDYTTLSVKTTDEDKDSDPISFYEAGLPAVLVVEVIDDKDGFPVNPNYHEDGDFYLTKDGKPNQVEGKNYIDAEYAKQLIRGAVAWTAAKAGLEEKTE